MSITRYTWNEQSPIQQMELHKLVSGNVEARIPVTDSCPPDMQARLKESGLHAIRDVVDGEQMLRVTGTKKADKLLKALDANTLTSGTASQEVLDQGEKRSAWQWAKANGIQLSGILGMIGHVFQVGISFKDRVVEGVGGKDIHNRGFDKSRWTVAAMYGTATMIPAVLGAGNPEEEFAHTLRGLERHLHKSGIDLPEGASLSGKSFNDGGIFTKAYRTLLNYPIETKILLQVSAIWRFLLRVGETSRELELFKGL